MENYAADRRAEKSEFCGAICGCCMIFMGIILAFGLIAMSALGIYFIADNAAVAAGPDPINGWIPLTIHDRTPGFMMPATNLTGLCGLNTTYADYTYTCTYPATCNGKDVNCTCGIPPMQYAMTYYKDHSYPPEFHCGEIKSNYDNVRKRNIGIVLLIAPYGLAFVIVIVYACIMCGAVCCIARPKKTNVTTYGELAEL